MNNFEPRENMWHVCPKCGWRASFTADRVLLFNAEVEITEHGWDYTTNGADCDVVDKTNLTCGNPDCAYCGPVGEFEKPTDSDKPYWEHLSRIYDAINTVCSYCEAGPDGCEYCTVSKLSESVYSEAGDAGYIDEESGQPTFAA